MHTSERTPLQHGFYPGRSTATNVVRLQQYSYSHIDKGTQVDAIYTDLNAALDRVDHFALRQKLFRLGLRCDLVKSIVSYLYHRTLVVKIGESILQDYSNVADVPQKSILGPLLFNIFINDVVLAVPKCLILLYADGLQMCSATRNSSDFLKLLYSVSLFQCWYFVNMLSINVSK